MLHEIMGPNSIRGPLDNQTTADIGSNGAHMSRIGMAVLEDQGFYLPNYDLAGFQRWGWQRGCDFVQEKCTDFQVSNPNDNSFCVAPPGTFFEIFFNPVIDESIQLCSEDRRAIGFCTARRISSSAPDEACGTVENRYSCLDPEFDELVEEMDGVEAPNCVLPSLYTCRSMHATGQLLVIRIVAGKMHRTLSCQEKHYNLLLSATTLQC